ncbi:MAG: hypothetical protein IPI44_11870 [Sulfuritalea sp.]|nr:hypothetical protein [Sulfuritalea sp.]
MPALFSGANKDTAKFPFGLSLSEASTGSAPAIRHAHRERFARSDAPSAINSCINIEPSTAFPTSLAAPMTMTGSTASMRLSSLPETGVGAGETPVTWPRRGAETNQRRPWPDNPTG